jgi:hypothetical protein
VQRRTGDAQAASVIQDWQWERAADDPAMMLQAIVTGLGNTDPHHPGAARGHDEEHPAPNYLKMGIS